MWALEYVRMINLAPRTRNLVPSEASPVTLAVTMEERCAMLKDMGARFCKRASDYSAHACINGWETRVGGRSE